MLTPDERRALIFLACVSVGGALARTLRAPQSAGAPPGPPSAPGVVAPQLAGGDIVRQAELSLRAQAATRPLGPGERVDIEHATAEELARLPRIGRRLALRIVADRRDRGPFGTLAGLARVPGLTPGVLRDLAPYATFGGVSAAVTSPEPGLPPAPRWPPDSKPGRACSEPIPLNQADAETLQCLPGIGPVLAVRIVAERDARGPFRDAADLARVKGLGKTRIERLRPHVAVP